MAKQKQGGGKSGKNLNIRITAVQNKGRSKFKQSPEYLRGPKNGGPTLAEIVAAHDSRIRREEEEARLRDRPWGWRQPW